MGNQCSQASELNIANETNVDMHLRPKVFSASNNSSDLLSVPALPILKSNGDIEVKNGDQSQINSSPIETAKESKHFSRFQSNDPFGASQNDETNVPLSKKAVSFFHFNSIENPSAQIEFSGLNQGNDDWNLKNIRLDSLIQKSNETYLWEAYNTVVQRKCAIKVRLLESSKLLHNNFSRTELILKELNTIKDPHLVEVYSFSIWESEVRNKPHFIIVIVQEVMKCTLYDAHIFKIEKRKAWTQDQILTILHDTYSGLATCKERQVTHGNLSLDNIFISIDMCHILLGDFNLKLPIAGAASPPGKSLFAKQGNNDFDPSEAERRLSVPADKDIQSLTKVALQLVTMDENVGMQFEELSKDERYKKMYGKVFDILDIIMKRIKSPAQIIKELQKFGEGKERFGLEPSANILSKIRLDEAHVDTLFTKIDCYELINCHEKAKEVYSELMTLLEKKNMKGPKECEEYVRCVNKTINYYLSMNNWLKAKEISSELSSLLKKDQELKKAIKAQPKEYITFIFLLGKICEGINEPEKAITFYTKGLSYCGRTNADPNEYCSALKNISNLLLKKKDYTHAHDYLKKLATFYEAEDEFYNEKADTYIKIGDILTLQDHPEQSVKLYLKSIDNLKKGKINNDIAILDIMKKVTKIYKDLNEEENALFYMLKSQDLKKNLFGNDSREYMEAIKEVGDVYMSRKNYDDALNFYLKYYKICSNNEFMTDQYATSLGNLGDVYSKLKKCAKAGEYYEKYSKVQENLKGKKSKEFLVAQDKLADIAFRENKFQKSLNLQKDSFALKEDIFDQNDIYIVISLSNIGDTYLAIGQYEKSLQCHQDCLEKLETRKNEFRQERSQILLKMAYDYDKLGNSGQALALVHKSFQTNSKSGYGTDMEKTIEVYETLSKLKETKMLGLNFSRLDRELV